jgi:oxygen-independent coproporphyrinogen III oxidase
MSLVQTLLQYNASAPRYTSYPPANLFTSASTDAPLQGLWEASNQLAPRNLSFYFHVPFCPKRCHFCGCNSEVTGGQDAVDAYFSAVRTEMETRLPWLDAARPLTQIHFGGGTPNAVPARYLGEVLERLRQRFSWSPSAEVAIECNPAHLSRARLQEYRALGFNRISLGIQDFSVDVLRAIGRDPAAYPVCELVADCRDLGFSGINLDLVYGLPGQTLESFSSSVEQTITAAPDRVALFSYAHVPWVQPNQKLMDGLTMPGPELKVQMFLAARERFLQAGFLWVGMDHFVRPADPLGQAALHGRLHRNFQGYCDRSTTGQVYGFGCSSISQLDNAYMQNVHASSLYTQRVLAGEDLLVRCHILTKSEKILRDALADFMCNGVIHFTPELGEASQGGWERLCALAGQGLVELVSSGEVRATGLGKLVIRYLAMQLDPLMQGKTAGFSKTL